MKRAERMASASPPETERWVQCTLCNKWRVVPLTLRVDETTTPWRCAYNVFSSTHNQCAAPQEPMPGEAEEAAAGPSSAEIVEELFAGYACVEENSVDDIFTESTCTCSLCTSMNAAAHGWNDMVRSGHPVPLVQCVLDAINNSLPVARAAEDEKRFLYLPGSDPTK